MKHNTSFKEGYDFDLKAEVEGVIQHFDELLQTNTNKSQHREKACHILSILKREHDITDYENTVNEFHKEYVEELIRNMKYSPATTFEAVVIDGYRLLELQIGQGVKGEEAENRILANLESLIQKRPQ